MSKPQDAVVVDAPSLQPPPTIAPKDNLRESPEANHLENGKPKPPSSSGVPAQESSMILYVSRNNFYINVIFTAW